MRKVTIMFLVVFLACPFLMGAKGGWWDFKNNKPVQNENTTQPDTESLGATINDSSSGKYFVFSTVNNSFSGTLDNRLLYISKEAFKSISNGDDGNYNAFNDTINDDSFNSAVCANIGEYRYSLDSSTGDITYDDKDTNEFRINDSNSGISGLQSDSSVLVFACEASYSIGNDIHDNLGLYITHYTHTNNGTVDGKSIFYSSISIADLKKETLSAEIKLAQAKVSESGLEIKNSSDSNIKALSGYLTNYFVARKNINDKLYNFYFVEKDLLVKLLKADGKDANGLSSQDEGFIFKAYYSDTQMMYHGGTYYYNMGLNPKVFNAFDTQKNVINGYLSLEKTVGKGEIIVNLANKESYDDSQVNGTYPYFAVDFSQYAEPITCHIIGADSTKSGMNAAMFGTWGIAETNYSGAYVMADCSSDNSHKTIKLYKDTTTALASDESSIKVTGFTASKSGSSVTGVNNTSLIKKEDVDNSKIKYIMHREVAEYLNENADNYLYSYALGNATLLFDKDSNSGTPSSGDILSYELLHNRVDIGVEQNGVVQTESRAYEKENGKVTIIMHLQDIAGNANKNILTNLIAYTAKLKNINNQSSVSFLTGFGGLHTLSSSGQSPTLKMEVAASGSNSGYTYVPAQVDGASFRYDKKLKDGNVIGLSTSGIEISKAIDYVDMRFKYEYTLPTGLKPENIIKAFWTIKIYDGEKYLGSKTVNSNKQYLSKGSTYISNAVLTNIPVSNGYDSMLNCTFSISYYLDGKPYEFIQSDLYSCSRSIKDIIKYYADYVAACKNDASLTPLSKDSLTYLIGLTNACGEKETSNKLIFENYLGTKYGNQQQ